MYHLFFFLRSPNGFCTHVFHSFFFKHYYGFEWRFTTFTKYFWIPALAILSSLSGALNPGIALIVSLLVFVYYLLQYKSQEKNKHRLNNTIAALKNIPKEVYCYFLPICMLSMYSLFLGRFNAIDLDNKMPLSVMYARLPEGIYYSFTQKLGFPVLFAVLLLNTCIIRFKLGTTEGKKILRLFQWIGIFALIYILLLPLGGYRSYRPYILRYDTIMPITIALLFIYGKTTLFILKHISLKQKYWYVPLVIVILFIYTNADKANLDNNACEREALAKIASSNEAIVALNSDCTVLSWNKIENPKESELNARLLKLWNIIEEDKLYYTPK